ncbi:hypothetical protein EMCRGX_G000504 [Ephydatia muelleri]
MTAVYPVERRVIWAWFRHDGRTLLDSLHLMTAVYPVERRVIWAWFRHQAFVVSLVLKPFRVKVYTRDICEMRKQYGLKEIENPLFQSQQMYIGICQLKCCTLNCYILVKESILSKQGFQIACCDFFSTSLYNVWQRLCHNFVDDLKEHMPVLLKKPKIQIILHLWFESFNSMVTRQKYTLSTLPLKTITGSQTTTLGALQLHDSQFDIRLEELTTSDTVQEVKAVIFKDSTVVNLGEFIELVTPYDQMQYGLLLATFNTSSDTTHCLVQGFH